MVNDARTLLQNLFHNIVNLEDYETVVSSALAQSLIPDKNNNLPNTLDYIPTYDVYYSAYLLSMFFNQGGGVKRVASENTSIETIPINWDSLRSFWTTMSPILQMVNPVINSIEIPVDNRITPVSMTDKEGYFGDVDTDIN